MSEETITVAPAAPTAEQWREAFMAMETMLNRIDNMAKVAELLAGELQDDADNEKARVKPGFYHLAEVTCRAVFNLIDMARDAERAYYVAFNDLVGQENAALLAQTGGANG
ncbi:hypothetical protein [Mesorhizobium amorphae]|uniref:hypothetical protein n=1 Tax=Mesorhizobium amorphae TaxID=71433 RepID=UPI001181F903|nr:hypothetical protein [Mesorhizobium amorphae]